jgi:hypothetical protein
MKSMKVICICQNYDDPGISTFRGISIDSNDTHENRYDSAGKSLESRRCVCSAASSEVGSRSSAGQARAW